MRRWIAPIFLTHAGCRYRCIFCNQFRITGHLKRPCPEEVQNTLEHFFISGKDNDLYPKQIAFYGGSFTGLDISIQQEYLNIARRFIQEGRADSIRVSVRPDQLAPEILSFLYANDVRTVEIGIQSLCEEVLETARRGHNALEALEALERAKDFGMEVGAQIMVGLPRDDMKRSKETVEKIVQTKTDFVRIYPVLVVKDTELEKMFRDGLYRPLTIKDAVSICKELVSLLEEASIRVIRIGLQEDSPREGPSPSWIAGPYHPAFGHLVRAAMFRDKVALHLHALSVRNTVVSFRMHPFDRSLFQGHRKENLYFLSQSFNLKGIKILEDPSLPRGSIHYMLEA